MPEVGINWTKSQAEWDASHFKGTTNIATDNATVGEQRGNRNVATGNATVGRQIGRTKNRKS